MKFKKYIHGILVLAFCFVLQVSYAGPIFSSPDSRGSSLFQFGTDNVFVKVLDSKQEKPTLQIQNFKDESVKYFVTFLDSKNETETFALLADIRDPSKHRLFTAQWLKELCQEHLQNNKQSSFQLPHDCFDKDFDHNTYSAAAVPSPNAIILSSIGLIAVGLMKQRRIIT